MAYGQFTDYAPLDNGAYQFQRQDGPPVTLFGDPADELRRRVEAAKAFEQSQMLASNAPSAPSAGMARDYPELFPGAEPAATPQQQFAQGAQNIATAQQARDAALAKQYNVPLPPAPGQAAPQPQQQTVYPIAQTKNGDPVFLRPGGDPANPGDYVVQERARAATKGGLRETGRTVKGGFEPSEEYLNARQEAQQKLELGQRIAFEAGAEKQQMEHAALQGQMLQQELQAREALDQQEQVDKGVAEKQAIYEKASNDYKSGKIDPDRYMKGNWQAGVAVVIAAMAAALPSKKQIPNLALDMIQRRIDQDIHAQETELAVKKDAAQGALGDLQRKLGSQNLAREALRGIRMQQAQTQLQLLAKKTEDAETAAAYLQASAEMGIKYADFLENYRKEAAGEVTSSMRYQGGSAGSRGGTRPLTLDEAGTVTTIAAKGGRKGVGGGQQGAQTTAASAEIDVHLNRLNKYDDKSVPKLPENRNVATRTVAGIIDWAAGAGTAASGLSAKERAEIQDTEDAKAFVKASRSVGRGQGAMTDTESKAMDKGLAPGASVGELKRALRMAKDVNTRILQRTGWDQGRLQQELQRSPGDEQ